MKQGRAFPFSRVAFLYHKEALPARGDATTSETWMRWPAY